MDKIKLVTLNCRGLKNKLKRMSLFYYLKSKKFDIICLQEAHITKNDLAVWKKQWGGELFCREGTSKSRGEVILVGKHFTGKVELKMVQDRIMIISVLLEKYEFFLGNVYAPNGHADKMSFYKELHNKCNEFSNSLILMGDFNCVINNKLDIISGSPHNEKEIQEFNNLIKQLELTDSWRAFHVDERDYSWNRNNPFIARRLDYCLISENLIQNCVECEHLTVPNSDHKAVAIELNEGDFQRGPGFWKFNNSYLKNIDFVNKMNSFLDDHLNDTCNEDMSDIDKWEICKVLIRSFCSEFGKQLSCSRKNDSHKTYIDILDKEKELIKDPTNKNAQTSLTHLKQKLEIAQLNKAKGAQVRAGIKWVEEGERNTKYFCNLEKARGKKRSITRLRKETGEIVSNQQDVLQELTSFYGRLYNQKVTSTNIEEEVDTFLENEEFPRLSEEDIDSCEGLISLEESTSALKMMKNGSAPGSDGITIEFLKFFWVKLGKLITNSFIESFHRGELSYTQKQGIITLIHKGNELDREELTNWRPITLTNTDYKILAKALAVRLSGVIHKIVNDDQVGYIKGRSSSIILRTIDDVINYLNKTNKAGYLLAIDYTKAFDSISKPFLFHAFKVFGFGPDFYKWVKLLNYKTSSNINNGGWLSESFDVSCGIRQGCPFSPLAFVLAVELLAIKIRNSDIEGIKSPISPLTNPTFIKIKQLADDTTLFLKNKEDTLKSIAILQSFQHFSGLKINAHTTKVLKMGRQDDENIPFTVVTKIKILGIYFESNKMAKELDDNWTHRIDHINSLIKQWSKRDLSILGKVVVIKTFLISQLTYVMQSVGLPHNVLCKINTILYKFLWQKKQSNRKAFEKVKRKTMETDFEMGGIRMINMVTLQKCYYLQWAGKLFEATGKHNWTSIPLWHVEKIARNNNVFYINCKLKDVKSLERIDNHFWKEVVSHYIESKDVLTHENITTTNFHDQLIFNNSLITYKGKTLFFQPWIDKGIEKIRQIVHPNENRILTLNEMQGLLDTKTASIVIDYNLLINAIPKSWIRWIQSGEKSKTILSCEASRYNASPRQIKTMLPEYSLTGIPCSSQFWKRKFDILPDKFTWARAKDVTKETRLLVLHWKILHHIYATNIILNKMQIKGDNKCSYCTDKVDYIEHFFYDCPTVQTLWKYIEEKISTKLNIQFTLSVTNVLFGVAKSNHLSSNYSYINNIILIGKMSISIYKKTESVIPLQHIFDKEFGIRQHLI